jgi:hypothetical protein
MKIMEGPQLCLSLALAAKTFRPPLRAIGQLRTLLLGRARCLGPFSESLNMEARQAHLCPSSLEGVALYDGHRDSFRRLGCAGAVHSWHRRGHRRNSDHGRRCRFRSRDDTGRRRQGVGRTPLHNRRPRHDWGRCQGFWETSPWTRTTVSQPGTVGFRDMPDAPTVVVGVPRRTVFQNGRRVLADSELDDDPFSDQCRLCREVTQYCHDAASSRGHF